MVNGPELNQNQHEERTSRRTNAHLTTDNNCVRGFLGRVTLSIPSFNLVNSLLLLLLPLPLTVTCNGAPPPPSFSNTHYYYKFSVSLAVCSAFIWRPLLRHL